jgi:hypothetical protein
LQFLRTSLVEMTSFLLFFAYKGRGRIFEIYCVRTKRIILYEGTSIFAIAEIKTIQVLQQGLLKRYKHNVFRQRYKTQCIKPFKNFNRDI